MKSTLTKALFFSIVFLSFLNVNAQQAPSGGTITGKLVDAANNQPIELATISLVKKADNKPVTSLQTDLQGNFKLTGIENGTYILRATYVSYLTYIKDTLNITSTKKTINLGNIKLRQGKGLLKEVVITAQKSQIQLGIDKKSFNVDQSLVSQGGSATDLLSNVPSVQVDVDGNLSLRGSSNVRVLINGKPSALTGGNITDILQSIPASSIETIEVITNPSSKYDAEGQSGIINIVLKKNVQKGFTGSASASVGTQNTYNGNFSLAYQNSKINVYSNYSYRKGTRIGNGFTDKTTDATDGTDQTQNQLADQKFTFTGQNIRSGIDFNISPKTTIGFSNNINIRDRDRDQTGSTLINQNGSLLQRIDQNNISTGSGTNLDFNLDFDHKFKTKGEELTANVGYSIDKNHNFDDLNNAYYYYSLPLYVNSVQNNTTVGRNHNWNFQADYTKPLKDGKLEMGFRSTINNSDNNYVVDTLNSGDGNFDFNPFLSNRFIYKENVNALYTNYQHQFGKFGIQAGLRLEDAHIRTSLVDSVTTPHKQDYFRVYPSVFLTEKLSENQTLQLSYSRRVTRPRDRQLSPFIDESNKLNYSQGNPDLKPEDTHSFELSYINYWKTVTLTSSIYYRLTNQNIQQITTPLTPTNLDTTLTQFQNIKSASNAGYELIAKVSPTPMVDFTANVNIYYRHIDGDAAFNLATTSGYAWNGNLTANIKPAKKLGFQIRGDYSGPQVIPQGKMKAMYGVDGGVKYDITKTLNISGNVRDIFNTRKYESDISYSTPYFTSTQVSQRRFATRTALLTLSYRFGNNGFGQKAKSKNKDQQDQDNGSPDDGGGLQGGQTGGGAGVQPGAKPKG
ncbi:TonB-dependent receptor domain-containing protein [Mucilaginibacter sp.]|uniref:TonB-dependent receptor domain-containing protein n=1 Tax=Mucilaginibacter sp. TaxID=1882438 RepID=UPI003D146ADB